MSAATDAPTPDLQRRAAALTETMAVVQLAPDLFEVTKPDAARYVVDIREGSCECPDSLYRDGPCKHVWRCRYEAGVEPLPDWIDSPERLAPFFRARWRRRR
jgi:hypothetical protein